jgi:antirestriction protein ArdC
MQENEDPVATQKTVHARITEEILAGIVAGAPKFEMPWHSSPHMGFVGSTRPANGPYPGPKKSALALHLWREVAR